MQSSTKLFFITVLLVLLSSILFYKGIEQELVSRDSLSSVTASPNPTDAAVLGEQEVSSSASASASLTQPLYQVEKVIDGDTIEVLVDGEKRRVRLIGVDTPETVDPNRPKGCFGKEASDETKRLLEGKSVYLVKDVSETDKYQRLLRYVYVPLSANDQLFVNDYLIREGFGTVLTYPPDVKYSTRFLEAQRVAKEGGKGLWGKCGR